MQFSLIFSPAPFSPLSSQHFSLTQLAYSGLVPNTRGNVLPTEFCFWQIFSFVSCVKLPFITLLWRTFERGLLRELLPALVLFFFFFLLGPFWVTCPFCIVLPGLNVGVLAIVYHLCPRAGAGSLTAAVLGQWGPTVLNPLAPKQADTCNCGAGGVVYDKPVLWSTSLWPVN